MAAAAFEMAAVLAGADADGAGVDEVAAPVVLVLAVGLALALAWPADGFWLAVAGVEAAVDDAGAALDGAAAGGTTWLHATSPRLSRMGIKIRTVTGSTLYSTFAPSRQREGGWG